MASVARSGKKGGKGPGGEVLFPGFQRFQELPVGLPLDEAGELEFRGLVAEGDWSCVLKVLHKSSNSFRALRLVRPELVASEVQPRLFEEELERAAAVAGEFAAKLFDMGTLAIPGDEKNLSWWFLTMEWVEGRSLRELLSGGRFQQALSFERYVDKSGSEGLGGTSSLSAEDALRFVEQAAEGVAELHRAGVYHFDIKPEHLILSKQGRVRLIGHGLSPDLRREGLPALTLKWRSSQYAPDELARGEFSKLGPRCDVYQLGMLTYELFLGHPCMPWVSYEELCETIEFLPAAMDELIQDCLDEESRRPADADAFLKRLRLAAEGFDDNQRHHRARSDRKAKEIWSRAQAMAEQADPQWAYVAGMCQRLLEVKPHLLPFGKIPAKQVEELLGRAQEKLLQHRRAQLEAILAGQAWEVAAAFVDHLGGEVPSRELDELRLQIEMAQIEAAGKDPAARADSSRRLMELLKASDLDPALREKAAGVLEGLLKDGPLPPAPEAAAPEGGSTVPEASARIQVLTDLGVLDPISRFQVDSADSSTMWRVIVGPAVRLGRGSFDEFGNHVDLRPTRREAAESSITLALAQRLSRAGHLELRVGPEGLEAFCMGTHGAAVSSRELKRGERVSLGDDGQCLLAQGATALAYKVWKARDGAPLAVELSFTGGVGAGRHAAWVLGGLPLQLLCPDAGVKGIVIPTSEGWLLESKQDEIRLGHQTVAKGERAPWPSDVILELEKFRIQHS